MLSNYNSSYFNLTESSSIAGTEVTLSTNKYLVVDDNLIPQGPIEEFPGIKSKTKFTLGEQEPDIDHCFVVDTDANNVPIDTRSRPVQKLASFYHPESKIHLEVSSTEPTFQFYTGKHIDVPAVEGLPARGSRAGFCVEPARYVNAINVPEQKSQMTLKKGEKYGCKIIYRGWHA
jgi:aldose 1-epimerase